MPSFPQRIASLKKAELHLHLEGSIRPPVTVELARHHGTILNEEEVRRRYNYSDFPGFIEAFKWVTSFLRGPQDFAIVAADLADQLLTQNVVYAEITLSVGIMLLRGQNPQANFEALLEATQPYEARGLRLNWIFDAVRQFGPQPAMQVVDWARLCRSPRIVAFGIGGDELSFATSEFRAVYFQAANYGLHRLIHAGEIGGPEKIREAIELLRVERIGHGIAAIHDPALLDLLTDRRIPLEICPVSNVCTGALARLLQKDSVDISEHPLPRILRHGVPVVLSTDDPAMFHTSLLHEYEEAHAMGLGEEELAGLIEQSFQHSFLSPSERANLSRGPA